MKSSVHKLKVKELKKGRRANPLFFPVTFSMFGLFNAARMITKILGRIYDGYGPTDTSPESQEYFINYLDFVGWKPFLQEVKDLAPISPYFLANEAVVFGALRRMIKSQCMKEARTEAQSDLWQEMEENARKLGVDMVGYSLLNRDYIFQGMHVFYPNLVVLGMEMRWQGMLDAPGIGAGKETMRTYHRLGAATNKLADFFMDRGYRAQPMPPYSAYVLWPAIAKEAGLAERGLHGLMITPRFGPLQRWSAVAVEAAPLPETDAVRLDWLEGFCASCRQCIQACPAQAIMSEPVRGRGELVRYIDNERCYPYFARYKSCSICIKVCTAKLRKEGRI